MKNKILLLPAVLLVIVGCGKTQTSVSDSLPASEPAIEYISETVLASIRGAVKFEGTYSRTYVDEDDYIEEYGAVSVFEEGKYYNLETFDGEIVYELNAFNVTGKAHATFLDETNTVVTGSLGEGDVAWENFVNPFAALKTTDFVKTESGKFAATGDAASETAFAAYGYSGVDIETVELTVANEKVTKIVFLSETYEDYNYGENVIDFGEFNVKDHGTAKVPTVKAFETKPEHAALATALSAIGDNFTAEMVVSGEPTTIQFTEDAVLVNGPVGYDENSYETIYGEYGYLVHENIEDKLFSFDFVEGDPVLTDIYEGITMLDIAPDFASAIPEFFEFKGEGLYVAHAGYAAFAGGPLATAFFQDIAEAAVLSVQLDDLGNLESFEYTYYFWGMFQIDVLITFSEVGTTAIDYDFAGFRNQIALLAQIPEEMMGNWAGTFGEEYLEVAISELGIVLDLSVNGEPAGVLSSDILSINDFTIVVKDYDGDPATLIYDEVSDTITIGDFVLERFAKPIDWLAQDSAIMIELLGEVLPAAPLTSEYYFEDYEGTVYIQDIADIIESYGLILIAAGYDLYESGSKTDATWGNYDYATYVKELSASEGLVVELYQWEDDGMIEIYAYLSSMA